MIFISGCKTDETSAALQAVSKEEQTPSDLPNNIVGNWQIVDIMSHREDKESNNAIEFLEERR